MSAYDPLREAVGANEILELLGSIAGTLMELSGTVSATPQVYNLRETSEILRTTQKRVKEMIDEGLLWRVEGLDAGKNSYKIPRAAIEELLRRPS